MRGSHGDDRGWQVHAIITTPGALSSRSHPCCAPAPSPPPEGNDPLVLRWHLWLSRKKHPPPPRVPVHHHFRHALLGGPPRFPHSARRHRPLQAGHTWDRTRLQIQVSAGPGVLAEAAAGGGGGDSGTPHRCLCDATFPPSLPLYLCSASRRPQHGHLSPDRQPRPLFRRCPHSASGHCILSVWFES